MGITVRPWKPADRKLYAKLDADTKKQDEARKKAMATLKKKER